MSSHPYVSQLNTPLDDDTTLMSLPLLPTNKLNAVP